VKQTSYLWEFAMAEVVILGATGSTGIHLANILRGQKVAVRVVSRSGQL
jgi:N-acetyl-gamma-glutamylphosphate reductase